VSRALHRDVPDRDSARTEFEIRGGRRPSQGPLTDQGAVAKLADAGRRLGGRSLLTRIVVVNAVVLAAAVLVLALSPVTVSDPLALQEAVVLVTGLAVLVTVNLVLFRRSFAALARLIEAMRTIDLLEPPRRIPAYGDDVEVAELTLAFNEMLDRLETERRESTRRSLGAQEGERRRVAQELHDEVGQSLTAVVLQLDRVSRSVPDSVRHELAEALDVAGHSLEEVRQIAQRLRPEALDDLGLQSALATLAERLARQGGLRVVRRLDRRLPPLSREVELVIYRVAQ
jgi:two-component system, NarL family, sensor histidine kinase UhpB